MLRAVLGTGVYLAAIGVLGAAIGALLRHAAGSIGVMFVLLLVASGLLGLVLPDSWSQAIVPYLPYLPYLLYLPSNAGASFTSVVPADGLLAAGPGAAVLVAWIVVLLGGAEVLLRRRDA
ncbi:MAG: hypothetical protein HHJ14_03890 [Cellulomonas sp.]|uniref:hypothetical protein n=1 Tax=Cellulomonas sp. TaxID=40001 RepID=UPI001838F83B|nr:hypothetical protein [Cellulomonas sp.]NMM16300.1 hypothetical protein [Cellulomonas sp.]NMM31500.1 hypothetical protein [Cellulomonas sp.]